MASGGGAVREVRSRAELDDAVGGARAAAVHFWASWCEANFPHTFFVQTDDVFAHLAVDFPHPFFLHGSVRALYMHLRRHDDRWTPLLRDDQHGWPPPGSLPCHAEEEQDHCPAVPEKVPAPAAVIQGTWARCLLRLLARFPARRSRSCCESEPGNLATRLNPGRRGEADRGCWGGEEKLGEGCVVAGPSSRSIEREVWSPA